MNFLTITKLSRLNVMRRAMGNHVAKFTMQRKIAEAQAEMEALSESGAPPHVVASRLQEILQRAVGMSGEVKVTEGEREPDFTMPGTPTVVRH